MLVAAAAVAVSPELVDLLRGRAEHEAVDRSAAGIALAVVALLGGGVGALLLPGCRFGAASAALFWLGIDLVLVGTAVRWWAIRTLGRYFSRGVEVRADHRVVSWGPYAVVRHPAYTGTLLSMVGVGLALGTWLSLAVAVVGGTLALGWRIRREERVLRDEVEGYDSYRESVPYRLLPPLW